MDLLKNWYFQNIEKKLPDYFEFLRFKSIANNDDIHPCANWLKNYLKTSGLSSEIIKTKSAPIVFGEKIENKDYPTLLLYGHYDVMPVNIKDWDSDPFEPVLKDDIVYARGASDNKGQIFYVILAVQAFLEIYKNFPINLKVCFEGEEESQSSALVAELPRLKDKFKTDYLIACDCDIPSIDTPAVTLGLRGIAPLEIDIIGSKVDLHSGIHGGIAYNPLRAMVEVLAKMWDSSGKIQVEHFYDDVEPISQKELDALDLSFDKSSYQKMFGIDQFGGEDKFSFLESNWIRPTLEINGITGGAVGEEHITVIPSRAHAKISCRLVPNQDPQKIASYVESFIKKHIPPEMKLKVTKKNGGFAIRENPFSDLVEAVSIAYSDVFNKECKKVLAGGSIPVVCELKKVLKSQIVMMGCGLKEDNIHGPNEQFSLKQLNLGFLTIARIFQILGNLKK
jgi:acetylornithine deacetylase/succinyl-diaminopimelate desuccinylase-like protein